MDPVSIAGAVGPTLKILYTVTTTLYSFIASAKKVDKSLENLNGEVRGLTRVLEDIETFLKDVVIAQTSRTTSRKDGVWGPISNAIQDTQRTIKALQEILDRLGPPSRVTNGFKKTVKQIQLDFNSDEISNIRSRIQCHSTILQMALQTATLAIICMTNDNVINAVNPKLDSILPLVEKVESLIKQFEKLPSQLTAMHEKRPKDFHNSDMAEYTRQLKQSAEATIMTASTIIDSQSTIVNGNTPQHSSSSSSGEFSHKLRKRKVEEWISHLAINREEPGLEFDSISELMPDDSISCIGSNSNWQSQNFNGVGLPGPLPRTSKSAENPTIMDMRRRKPVKSISEETLAHMNLDGRSSVSTEEDIENDNKSEKSPTEYQADSNLNASYDEKSAKELILTLMKPREAKEWSFNDALLELAKMEAGQGVRGSANSVGTVLYLLEQGADINVKDIHGNTALHHVSKGGNTAVLDLLCRQCADINVINKSGQSALHLAAEWGHTPIVEVLLNNAADIQQETEHSRDTALSIAALNGCSSTVGYLLKAGAPVDSGDTLPLRHAASRGHLEIVEMLLTAGTSVEGSTALHHAAAYGHVEIAEMLLKAGASAHAKENHGWTPLFCAACKGHVEIVEVLFKAGASPNVKNNIGSTPLHGAAFQGHVGMVETLLKAGASANLKNDGWTPLHCAAEHGHVEIAQVLLKAGASVNLKNDGWTPLHCAAEHGHVEIAEILLKAGASADAKNNHGRTPLMHAAYRGHRTTIELLLAAGAHITARLNKGDTVLHLVLCRKHPEDCDKERCAFCAASETRINIVKLLCEHGADPSVKKNDGVTVLSWIRSTNVYPESEQRALINLLDGFGAK